MRGEEESVDDLAWINRRFSITKIVCHCDVLKSNE